jgi:hypothetical protein
VICFQGARKANNFTPPGLQKISMTGTFILPVFGSDIDLQEFLLFFMVTRDRYYDFKIFSPKKIAKKLAFFTHNKAK